MTITEDARDVGARVALGDCALARAASGCAIVISRTEFTRRHVRFLAALADTRAADPRRAIARRRGFAAHSDWLDGGTPAALAQTSKRMAAELRKHPAEFAAVNNGEDSALDQDREFLWRNRYLLSPAVAPGHFSARRAARCARGRPAALGSPAGALLRRMLPQDPTGELLRLIAQFEGVGAARGARRRVVFARRQPRIARRADPRRRLRHRRAGARAESDPRAPSPTAALRQRVPASNCW